MNAIIEITPRAVTVYNQAGALVWQIDLETRNGKRTAACLAGEILLHGADVLRLDVGGVSYRVPASADLAARIAKVL